MDQPLPIFSESGRAQRVIPPKTADTRVEEDEKLATSDEKKRKAKQRKRDNELEDSKARKSNKKAKRVRSQDTNINKKKEDKRVAQDSRAAEKEEAKEKLEEEKAARMKEKKEKKDEKDAEKVAEKVAKDERAKTDEMFLVRILKPVLYVKDPDSEEALTFRCLAKQPIPNIQREFYVDMFGMMPMQTLKRRVVLLYNSIGIKTQIKSRLASCSPNVAYTGPKRA
jgi:flagellar biosynthesis GTPase FlhF